MKSTDASASSSTRPSLAVEAWRFVSLTIGPACISIGTIYRASDGRRRWTARPRCRRQRPSQGPQTIGKQHENASHSIDQVVVGGAGAGMILELLGFLRGCLHRGVHLERALPPLEHRDCCSGRRRSSPTQVSGLWLSTAPRPRLVSVYRA